jgi:hypothetical protein
MIASDDQQDKPAESSADIASAIADAIAAR